MLIMESYDSISQQDNYKYKYHYKNVCQNNAYLRKSIIDSVISKLQECEKDSIRDKH